MNGVLHWSLQASPARLALLAVLLFAAAALMVRHIRRAGDRTTRRLEALRAIIVLMLGLTLLQPEVVRRLESPRQTRVAVLCDVSASMDTADVDDGRGGWVRRSEWVRQAVTNQIRTVLGGRYETDVKEVCAPPVGGGTDQGQTDLHAALESALSEARSLRAVVLLSDGDWNAGPPPALAAARLRAAGVPVYAICVGRAQPLPDVAVERVLAPAYGLADERLDVPVEVRNRLDRELQTEIRLMRDGRVVDRQPVRLAPQSSARARLTVRPSEPGEALWSVEVPAEPEETDRQNNRRDVRIPIRRAVLRVLLADTLPRWEYRYLRNALIRDPGTEVKCWLAHPQLPPGGGRDYLPAFPSARAEFASFDVVVLGDIGAGEGGLTAAQAEEIRGLVEYQGGGLILIAGRQGRQVTLAQTPLRDLLPVELDPTHSRGEASALEARFELTPDSREHPLVQLADDPASNDLLWRALPGFFWYARVLRTRPGTEVLAVHALARNEEGRIPLIAVRAAGLGRVLYMGTDAVWRWRHGVEDTYHYRFWGQVIRWMAHRRHLGHAEGLRWFTMPERPQVGQRSRIQVIAASGAAEAANIGTIHARITSPDGRETQMLLAPVEPSWGLHEGVWTADQAGPHQVVIRDVSSGATVAGMIEVSPLVRERVGEPARPDVMREIALVGGGRWADTAGIAEALAAIHMLPETQPVELRFRLWCHPVWGGAIGLALTAYWCARKLAGKL
ncbi:MAG: hypothetical protein N2652_00805 [Kiritimatiellae bacterium]|nr:hypothetical protein [Kiritimatiellia bacterium]